MRPALIAMVGPTATGKTEAAMALAKRIHGEIISMDAMQVYQGLRIGTARPLPRDWGGVRHHMLAAVAPDEKFSVAAYCQRVLPLIEEIGQRGQVPILCGGTGLYLEAVLFPLRFGETVEDLGLRERLAALSPQALHERLEELDPVAASRLPLGDVRRMIRALEIVMTTGRPMSQARDGALPRFDLLALGLTLPRPLLNQRIDLRVDRMIQEGLVEEVAFLLRHGLSPKSQAMQAIGYKECVGFLEGRHSLNEAVAAIKQGTHQYAKRQMTWLRRYPRLQWFDVSGYPGPAALHAALAEAALAFISSRKEGSHGQD